MAIDTFVVFVGVYGDVEDAEADYEAVKDLHTEAGLLDAYDAAVIVHREDGKVKITKKHETPTRVGGVLGGGVGLATGLVVALFPFAAIGGGLLLGATAGGALLGSVAGHAAAGMSRHDLKELGEQLDEGQAGLVVVGVADMEARVDEAMKKAEKVEKKQLKADNAAIEADAKEAEKAESPRARFLTAASDPRAPPRCAGRDEFRRGRSSVTPKGSTLAERQEIDMPRITPNLWFDTEGEEAAEHYVSIFPNSKVTNVTHYTAAGPRPEGTVLTVDFELDGQPFTAINGGPEFTFSEAVSFLIVCADQEEIDYYWEKLSDGGEEGVCGWLKDRYGLSWQVVPEGWDDVFKDPDPRKANAAMTALFGMKKVDVAAIQAAVDAV